MALVAAGAETAGGGVCDFLPDLFLSPLCSMTSDLELDGFHLTFVAQVALRAFFGLYLGSGRMAIPGTLQDQRRTQTNKSHGERDVYEGSRMVEINYARRLVAFIRAWIECDGGIGEVRDDSQGSGHVPFPSPSFYDAKF